MHDLLNINTLNKDRTELCLCTTLPHLPHPNPGPSAYTILFTRTGSHCSCQFVFGGWLPLPSAKLRVWLSSS